MEKELLKRVTILQNSLKLLTWEIESNLEITEQRSSKLRGQMRNLEHLLEGIMHRQEVNK